MFYFEHLNSKRPEHPTTAKMSASPIARQCISHSQVIPTKKVLIHDTNQLPDVYSSTPNGTLFSTTPGGKHPLFSFLTLFCVFFASSILCDTIFAHRHPAGDLRENLIFALIWAPAHTHTRTHICGLRARLFPCSDVVRQAICFSTSLYDAIRARTKEMSYRFSSIRTI